LAIDATGRHLLVANFAGGSVCVLPIQADGSLGEASQVIVHQGASVDPVRQQGPHPHAVAIDNANRFVLVPDLGIDKVMIYELDPAAGMLRPNPAQPFVATAAGAGPRQLVLHRNGELAYLINELDSTVTCYRYDHERGTLSELQTQSTLPIGFAGRSTCAEVAMSPCGRFLYGSNRGHDSIAIFAVDGVTGLLEARGHVSTRGATPRHFTVSPDGAWLIVANQDGGDVLVFRVDLTTGVPVWAGRRVEVGTPVCVQIL
jgi:6-phosphogluconolactonase